MQGKKPVKLAMDFYIQKQSQVIFWNFHYKKSYLILVVIAALGSGNMKVSANALLHYGVSYMKTCMGNEVPNFSHFAFTSKL